MTPHVPIFLRSRGFTLIELLVGVGIIAVLAVLSFAGFRSATVASDRAVCVNNMRLTAQAMLNYAAENNGYLPPINDSPESPYPKPNSWVNVLPQYFLGTPTTTEPGKFANTRQYLRCPTNRRIIVRGSGVAGEAALTSIHQLRTFAMNVNLGPKTTESGGVVTKVEGGWRTLGSIKNPARTILLSESLLTIAPNSVTCQPELSPGTMLGSLNNLDGTRRAGVHGDCNTIAWCDGHVSQWKDVRLLVDLNGPYREGKSEDSWTGY